MRRGSLRYARAVRGRSADHPEFVDEIIESFPACYPLTALTVIRHEPDDGFLACARAANAELIVTVNAAPDHFDRKQYLW